MKCKNCGHELEWESGLKVWVHQGYGNTCLEQVRTDDGDRYFYDACDCENPFPEKESEQKNDEKQR